MKNVKLKKLADIIKANNTKFNKLSKEEQIVEIAKDTIQRIKIEQLIPLVGTFINGSVLDIIINSNVKQFKTLINSSLDGCTVCAKGALFCSYVGRVNNFKIADLSYANSIKDSNHIKLLEIFDIEQLDLIEIAFEGQSYLHKCKDELLINKAEMFYYENGNSEERLLAICENIIKNKGVFIP
jgi:hypothetical protein